MNVKPLRADFQKYLTCHNIKRKFVKQLTLFKENPRHPSLHTERLEPKQLKIYSFRIDRKFRAIFILVNPNKAEIIDVNDHYR